jgi:uncharacterized alkaline shock family protein YloU
MDRINSLVISAKIKMAKAFEKMTSKENGDSQLVVALVLIAVAVGLCIIFRNQISNIMRNALNSISNSINNMLAGTISSSAGE